MAYQIKIIVKNSKPPVWRRMMIPNGITFSQLGLIINEVFELEWSDNFQFEFYQRKVQLEEEKEGKIFQPNFHYDLQEASNTYIDDYFREKEWCSYYLRDQSFRVEIEEIIHEEVELLILKMKGEFQNYGQDYLELMESLKQKFQIITTDQEHFEKQKYIIKETPIKLYRTNNPRSAKENIKKSADSMLKDFSEKVAGALMKKQEQIEEIQKRIKNVDDDTAEEELHQIMEQIYGIEIENFEKKVKQSYKVENVLKSDNKTLYLRDSLMGYGKKDMIDLAKEMHIRGYGSLTLAALAEKIANELLSISVMKKNFGIYSDEEIEAFEYAMKQEGAFSPSDEIWDRLMKPAEKDYISVYENDSMEMPVDVKEAYQNINTEEFHQLRKKKVWLIDCLKMIDRLYIVAPVDVLVRMYHKRKGFRLSKKEILDLLNTIPEEETNCVFYDNRIMSSDFCKNAHYKEVERSQGDKPFYIPTYEETIDYVRNLYPSNEPTYQKLMKFLVQDMKIAAYVAEFLVIEIYNMVSMGARLKDVIDMLNENNIVFNNEDEFVKIAEILVQINNDTRMVANRGYKPSELAPGEFESMRRNGRMPTIVPGSSHAAKMLMQGKDEIQKMGFHLDFDSNAEEVPITTISGDRTKVETTVKKVYPNDPCPCGSGKKYKKCCGRK